MGPLRQSAHLLTGSGRFPTLSDWRGRVLGRSAPRIRGLRVFAVEPTAVQLDWAALGPGPVTFRCADTTVDLVADGGPGAVTLDGLASSGNVQVTVSGLGVPNGATIRLSARLPAPPPGEEIARIATISDAHIGETTFGYLHMIGEALDTPPTESHSLRAVRAAVDESLAWGAQRLVCKGDIVDQSHPGHWRDTLDILEGLDVPVHLLLGNHEVKRRRSIEPAHAVAGSSVQLTSTVDHVDVAGSSLILVNSAVPDHERGRLATRLGAIEQALASTDGGALIMTHHHFRSGSAIGSWPVGVPHAESSEVLDRIGRIHPATMITSGHVHRNRARRHGSLVLTCVGSVKDYPGVWGGYVFHEGGIRQVIRRVAEPSVIAWTERTGDALGGFYRVWTPSTLAKRCVTMTWPGAG